MTTASMPGMTLASTSATTQVEPPPLTQEALKEILTLSSPVLVEEVFELTKQQVEAEDRRQTRLDAKATSLLTAAGVSVTVAATLGSALLTHAEKFQRYFGFAIAVLFITAIGFGLRAAYLAMMSLRVRSDYKGVSDNAIFDRQLLHDSDRYPKAEPNKPLPETDDPAERAHGLMEYRLALVQHFLKIATNNRMILDGKAKTVGEGQSTFVAFLITVFMTCSAAVLGYLLGNG